MARILITGAAGFIGSHTADLLLASGHEVLGIDNLRTGREVNLANASRNPRFRLLREDITTEGLLIGLVAAEKPDAILHLAALVSVPESIADPVLNRRLNLEATRLVTAAAAASASVRRIAFASSAAVYGANADLPLHETAQTKPLSPYGEAKLESEKILAGLSRSQPAISTVALRYFNVYGPRQIRKSNMAAVIAVFENQYINKRPLTVVAPGTQKRRFTHVKDTVNACYFAWKKNNNKKIVDTF